MRLAIAIIIAFNLNAQQYFIRKSIFSSAGANIGGSSDYMLKALAGQSVTGKSGDTTYIELAGFYTYSTIIITGIEEPGNQGAPFSLSRPYPNPGRGVVKITYSLPEPSRVSIFIYDVSGRLVKKLVNGVISPGRYEITWDGRTDIGTLVSQGIYFVEMEAPGYKATRKIIILK